MEPSRAPSGPVVLLVDEQAIIGARIRAMLEPDADIVLEHCQQPGSALRRAREVRPTVILQDLVMPDIDGFTLLRFYRADAELASVPVIVLSSKEDPHDKSRAFELGANDYLVKLPDRVELVARIRAHSRAYSLQRERDDALAKLQELMRTLEEANAELARRSAVDGLTGIPNRRSFDETLAKEWRRAAREQQPLSLALCDVDFFKKYNDHHGHVGGDQCLVRVAQALAACLRRPADLPARYGGEEFAFLLPNTNLEGARQVAERARTDIDRLALPHPARDDGIAGVTASFGVATIVPRSSQSPTSLIELADGALYEAKRSGRNRVSAAVTPSE